MTYAEKNILKAYTGLLEGLSNEVKAQLITHLSESLSLKTSRKNKEKAFFSSFGAFESEKSAEEQVIEIKSTRAFRNKDLQF